MNKYDPVHNKNPEVTDGQRKARREIYEELTKGMTKEELEELAKEVEEEKKKWRQ
mgnify:CR=1 FL=1